MERRRQRKQGTLTFGVAALLFSLTAWRLPFSSCAFCIAGVTSTRRFDHSRTTYTTHNLFPWRRRRRIKDDRSSVPVDTTVQQQSDAVCPLPPPPPPKELPLRFLRAGKNDPAKGRERYEKTLAWRNAERIDTILREPVPQFKLIKKYYPHYYHLKGLKGEPCYYELATKVDLKALRKNGVTLEMLLRYYTMITEFQWQVLEPDDSATSIYIVDLDGIRLRDFAGDVVKFVRQVSKVAAKHYPERAGYVFVVNVPIWFKIIWSVVRPIVDDATLHKIYILRGKKAIREQLQERIALENIPPEYGGTSMPLGQAPEEKLLADLIEHNNALARGEQVCNGCKGKQPCPFCTWVPPRSY